MLKNRIVYALVLIGLFLFYIYCNSYIAVFVLHITLILTFVSGVLAFIVSRHVTAEVDRASSAADAASRKLEFCAVLSNAAGLPAPMISFVMDIRDVSEKGSVHRRLRTSLSAFDKRRVFVSVDAPYAALVEASVSRLKVCDCFGVFAFPAKQKKSALRLLMTPAAKIEEVRFETVRRLIPDSDVYSDTQKGDDRSQVFELREYNEGDDLRNVHWPLSTKHDMLIVKEFSKPLDESCTVLVESSLGGAPREAVKQRADRVLAQFIALTAQLIEEGQPAEVCFYSPSAKRLCAIEVKKLEDTAAVMKAFLSEELPSEPALTYRTYKEAQSEAAAYYIYDSDAGEFTAEADSALEAIDAAQGISLS